MWQKATKKPVTIEYFHLTQNIFSRLWDESTNEPNRYCRKLELFGYKLSLIRCDKAERNHIIIETLEGNHKASMGDYIIKGVEGELYPCKPDIFNKTYNLTTIWVRI